MLSIKSFTRFNGSFTVPGSKSHANRYLILAAQNPESVEIKGDFSPQDVQDLISALKSLGLKFSEKGDSLIVKNSFPACELPSDNPITVNTGEGGTTNRFLIGLCSLGKNSYFLKPSGRILKRPFDELIETLMNLGVESQQIDEGFLIKGPLKKDDFIIEIDCSKTTQTASALKLIGLNISPINLETSEKYWNLTDSLNHLEKEYVIPPDFSSCSYPLVTGAILGEAEVSNISTIDTMQADSILINLLRDMGCMVLHENEALRLKAPAELKGFSFDLRRAIDLFPSLVVLASFCRGESKLSGIENLKYKESDRLSEMVKILEIFEVKNSIFEDTLHIRGRERDLIQRKLSVFPDHRIVMAGILMLGLCGGGQIDHSGSINKSYPQFLEQFTL